MAYMPRWIQIVDEHVDAREHKVYVTVAVNVGELRLGPLDEGSRARALIRRLLEE